MKLTNPQAAKDVASTFGKNSAAQVETFKNSSASEAVSNLAHPAVAQLCGIFTS